VIRISPIRFAVIDISARPVGLNRLLLDVPTPTIFGRIIRPIDVICRRQNYIVVIVLVTVIVDVIVVVDMICV
jgi:hypothetical protein